MLQLGRNLIDWESGPLRDKRYLIIDRDTKYAEKFRRLVRESGTRVIRLPPMSPNLNAYAERFVRSIKDECMDRMMHGTLPREERPPGVGEPVDPTRTEAWCAWRC